MEQIFRHTLSCVGYWKRLKSWANIFFFFVFSRRQTETKGMCTVIFFSFTILFMNNFYNFSVSRYWTWTRQRILEIIMLPFSDSNFLFVSTLFHFHFHLFVSTLFHFHFHSFAFSFICINPFSFPFSFNCINPFSFP